MSRYIELLNRLMTEEDAESGGGAEAPTDTGDSEGNAEPEANSDESEGESEGDAGEDTGDDTTAYADYELPEGMELDSSLVDEFNPLMKEAGLDQDQAQALASKMAEHVQAQQQSQQDAYSQQLSDWESEISSDKVIGGDKLEESIKMAQSAVEKLNIPNLKDTLNDTGMGSHPDIVRAFVEIGRLMGEDKTGSGRPVREAPDRVSNMYPTN